MSAQALRCNSCTRNAARERCALSERGVNELGLSLAETARQLGVTAAAITASFKKNKTKV